MAAFTHDEVLLATGGAVVASGPASFAGVSTDTREVKPGQLFVALRGERFDGHAFLDAAAQAGASGAIVQAYLPRAQVPPGFALYEVADTLRALGALGRHHRLRFQLPLCAVGGSNGKTTTKEMTAAILGTRGPTLATLGNFNNEIGVPLTLLRLTAAHVAAVIELGMNHAGEVARLTDLARPQAGVVTVVQPEHLEGLGSIEGVAHAEGELYRGLPDDGTAVANLDDPLAFAEARESGRKLLSFGVASQADVRLLGIDRHDASGMAFRIGFGGATHSATIPHVGAHNAMNACAAFALATALGYTPEECLRGLARSAPANRRLNVRVLPDGMTLIDDCYNANPGSMKAALETLKAMAAPIQDAGSETAAGMRVIKEGLAIAVLGDMLELGSEEAEAHRALVRIAGDYAQWVCLFGPRMKAAWIAEGKGFGRWFFEGPEALVAFLEGQQVPPRSVVLVKGSRGMRMERIVAGLTGEDAVPGGH